MGLITFLALLVVAGLVGIYLGKITEKPKKQPDKSQRDKDIEELMDKVNDLLSDKEDK